MLDRVWRKGNPLALLVECKLTQSLWKTVWSCLLTLLIVSFAVQKLLNLIRSHLFTFFPHYSRRWVIQDLDLCHLAFCLCFPLIRGLVSGVTFRSLIHFEFIFVYGVRKCSNFILLHVAVQFSQHHLLKMLSLPHCIFLPPLSKIRYQ